jgi:hypothetical protein
MSSIQQIRRVASAPTGPRNPHLADFPGDIDAKLCSFLWQRNVREIPCTCTQNIRWYSLTSGNSVHKLISKIRVSFYRFWWAAFLGHFIRTKDPRYRNLLGKRRSHCILQIKTKLRLGGIGELDCNGFQSRKEISRPRLTVVTIETLLSCSVSLVQASGSTSQDLVSQGRDRVSCRAIESRLQEELQ